MTLKIFNQWCIDLNSMMEMHGCYVIARAFSQKSFDYSVNI